MTSSDDCAFGDAKPERAPDSVILTAHVLFAHPTIDPGIITDTIGVAPTGQREVGVNLVMRNGNIGARRSHDSRWMLSVPFHAPRSDEEPPPLANVSGFLRSVLEPFMPHAQFVRRLAGEGHCEVTLNLPGQRHLPFIISPDVVAMIGELGLDLGVEVFPDAEM